MEEIHPPDFKVINGMDESYHHCNYYILADWTLMERSQDGLDYTYTNAVIISS